MIVLWSFFNFQSLLTEDDNWFRCDIGCQPREMERIHCLIAELQLRRAARNHDRPAAPMKTVDQQLCQLTLAIRNKVRTRSIANNSMIIIGATTQSGVTAATVTTTFLPQGANHFAQHEEGAVNESSFFRSNANTSALLESF